jgi:hypothetical protein
MKAGRNDPCPCGSGKKYKKCCLDNDNSAAAVQRALAAVSAAARHEIASPAHPQLAAGPTDAEAPHPPEPPDPVAERGDRLWERFQDTIGEERAAVFLEVLADDEVSTDELVVEMLIAIRNECLPKGERARFAGHVDELRTRRPDLFAESAHIYLSWRLTDTLADNRHDDLAPLARELATYAGRNLDSFNRAVDALRYHGKLDVIVDAMRIAWPLVKAADNIAPWGVASLAEDGVNQEVFSYLARTETPDPDDPRLLERIHFFIDDPSEDAIRELIEDLTRSSGREWQTTEFTLRPPRKRRQRDWDEEDEEDDTADPGAVNLARLTREFVGYLRREKGVSYARGGMVRRELYQYLVRRHAGDLDPRPSMLQQTLNPNLRLPKPPKPAHPLCPERVTLEAHLVSLTGSLTVLYYRAAALFQAMPAWLSFLQSRGLIDAATLAKVIGQLTPLHDAMPRLWKQYPDDPALLRQEQEWLETP